MRELRTITVAEIKQGDEFVAEETGVHYWTAVDDATPEERTSHVSVNVRHLDGGTSERVWDQPDVSITVVRDWPEETIDVRGLSGPDYVTDENGENPRDVYSREPLDL
jgi:hypothetical protein